MKIKEQILELIKSEPGIRTSQIIERIPYPCIDIIEALDELKDENQVEPKDIQVTDELWTNKSSSSSSEAPK